MKLIYIILLSVFAFFSCNNKNSLVDNIYSISKTLVSKEIDIINDDTSLKSYHLHSTFSYRDDDYIMTYNSRTHALDNFNVSKRTVSHINIDSEGQNGIPHDILGIHVHSIDSIWIYTTGIITLIDSIGVVKERIRTSFSDNEFPVILTNFSCCTSRFYYNSDRKSLFYMSVSIIENRSNFFVSEYSLTDHSTKKYPLNATETKDFRNDYGWKQYPNVTYTSKSILYNFPIESNIYVIDIESGENSVWGGKSQYTPNMVKKLRSPYEFYEADRHINENVHFFEILYDPIKDIYYRLHLSNIEYNAEINSDSLYFSKTMYIMVFNNNFEIINETKLDKEKYNYLHFWGMLNSGLFIAKDNLFYKNIDYEKLQIEIFNISDMLISKLS
jgi:hypothetical protein